MDRALDSTREAPAISRKAILDAGEAVISKRGFALTRVEDVAQAAGISAAAFRVHFPGTGALLRALNERFVEQMTGAIDASTRSGSWASSRVTDVVEIAVRTIIDVVFQRQGLVRAFLAHGATDRSLAGGLNKIGNHFTKRLVAALAECEDAPRGGVRPVAFSLLLSVALAHHCILVGESWAGVGFTREEVAEEASRAITAYLGARAPS